MDFCEKARLRTAAAIRKTAQLCQKSKKAAYFLASEGYPVKELIGGFKGWKKRDFDIIENEAPDYME